MMKNKYTRLAACLTALFVLFTLLVLWVDVRPIGPRDSSVGLAFINGPVHEAVKTNLLCYDISTALGGIAIGVGGLVVLLGIYFLIREKSLKKVPPLFFIIGGLYALCILFWQIFRKLVVNYRPILENGALASSYPSTHALLAVVFFGSTLLLLPEYVENKGARRVLQGLMLLAMALTILTRFLSGVHWFTDIIGGILLGAALLAWARAAAERFAEKR